MSRYLKLLISEEICGRFGSFDEQTTAYRLTRATAFMLMSDYVRSASLFVWFLFLLKLKHNKQNNDVPPEQWDDVQRFERQGYTSNCIST